MNDAHAKWIHGDGGPAVVLQEGATSAWHGAADFDRSLLQGGDLETDYDVICRCKDGVSVINRHGRDMLVLSDCEWPACFFPTSDASVVLIQWFGSNCTLEELVQRLMAEPPSATMPFRIIDGSLRLLVGADGGHGGKYGYSEVKAQPGDRVCDVRYSEEAQLIVLRPRA
jgi:hypothetical protein